MAMLRRGGGVEEGLKMFWEEWNHPDDVPSGGGRGGSKIVWGEWNHPSRDTHVNWGCVGRCARSEAGLRNDINSNCLAPRYHRFGAAVLSAFGHGDTTEQTERNTHKSAMLTALVLS